MLRVMAALALAALAGRGLAEGPGPGLVIGVEDGRITKGGQPFQIFEFQQETRLGQVPDYTWSGHLGKQGVNCLWLIAYQVGGDNAPGKAETNILALNDRDLDERRAWLRVWALQQAGRGRGGAAHVAIHENEQRNIPWATWTRIADRVLYITAEIPRIVCLSEEYPDGADRMRAEAQYLRDRGVAAISVSNPQHWHTDSYDSKAPMGWFTAANPMVDLADEGLVDIIALQERQENVGALASAYRRLGYAVIVHEKENIVLSGNNVVSDGVDYRDIRNSVYWAWSGWSDSSGFSVYPGYWSGDCNDLVCDKPEVYDELFKYFDISRRVQQGGGTPAAAGFLGVPFLNIDFNGDAISDAGDM